MNSRKMRDRLETALCCTRVGHSCQIAMRIEVLPYFFSQSVGGPLPDLNQTLVLFLFREQTTPKIALGRFSFFQCLRDDLWFFCWDGDIRNCQSISGTGGICEAYIFDSVGDFRRYGLPRDFINLCHQVFQTTLL